MQLWGNSAGHSYAEWTLLGVLVLGAILPLTIVGKSAGRGLRGGEVDATSHANTNEFSTESVRTDTRAPTQIEARGAPIVPTAEARAAWFDHELFGSLTAASIGAIVAAGIDGFVTAAIEGTLELVQLVALGITHEGGALSELGFNEYARSRGEGVVRIADILVRHPELIGSAAMGIGAAIVAQTLRIPEILASDMAATAKARALGAALYELGQGNGSGRVSRASRVAHMAQTVGSRGEHYLAAIAPLAIGARRAREAASKWPHIIDAEGRLLVTSQHEPLVRRLIAEGFDEKLLTRLDSLAGGIDDGAMRGTYWSSWETRRFDVALQQGYGGHLLRELQQYDPEQYLRAMLGEEPSISKIPLPDPLRAVFYKTQRDHWDMLSGENLLESANGKAFVFETVLAQRAEARLALAHAVESMNQVQLPRDLLAKLEREYELRAHDAHRLGMELDLVAGLVDAARNAPLQPLTNIDIDVRALSADQTLVRLLAIDDTRILLGSDSVGRNQFADRLAQLANAQTPHLMRFESTFLEELYNEEGALYVYARRAMNGKSDIVASDPFLMWHDERVNRWILLGENVPVPKGIIVPHDAAVLRNLLLDAQSNFDFLRTYYHR